MRKVFFRCSPNCFKPDEKKPLEELFLRAITALSLRSNIAGKMLVDVLQIDFHVKNSSLGTIFLLRRITASYICSNFVQKN